MNTERPTTGPYQASRKATLGAISHAHVLKIARDIMRSNQRTKGKRYSRKIKAALGVAQ